MGNLSVRPGCSTWLTLDRYPSLLESSDVDGGSSVAVLTYLWRILDSVDHPDLIHLILSYLLALSEPLKSSPDTPRTPQAQKARESLLSLSQLDGGDEGLSPSFFNLADLILASVQSARPETINAALRLVGALLLKHHSYAFPVVIRTTPYSSLSKERNIGALHQDLNNFLDLALNMGGSYDLDETFESSLKDATALIESHECFSSTIGAGQPNLNMEKGRNRSAILEDNSRSVHDHFLILEDPLLQSLFNLLKSFFTNSVETNLGLTSVIAHVTSCPHTKLEGWLTIDSSKYKCVLAEHSLSSQNEDSREDEDDFLDSEDPDKSEEARFGAFRAACKRPTWEEEDSSPLLATLNDLINQINLMRSSVNNLDDLVASRRKAFQGAEEIEQEARIPIRSRTSPRASADVSRDTSRSRGMTRAMSPSKQGRRSATPSGTPQKTNLTPNAKQNSSLSPRSQVRNLSPTKGYASGQPSSLASVMNADGQGAGVAYSTSPSTSDTASLQTEVFERRLQFPLDLKDNAAVAKANIDDKKETAPKMDGHAKKQASLNHVLTNIVILQDFVLEIAALIQVRSTLLDGEIKFV